jgi:hypothetical protein
MGLPPAEAREVSIKALNIDDIFGCGIRPHQMLVLSDMEASLDNKMIVILSDVQLDKPLVWRKNNLLCLFNKTITFFWLYLCVFIILNRY